MLSQNSGVYAIKCGVLGKMYVGSSVNMRNREYLHKFDLKNGVHKNKPLQKAYQILGEPFFSFEELERVEKLKIKEREQHYLNSYCLSLFNRSPCAFSPKGVKHTEETKQKFREAHKTRPAVTEATRQKLREAMLRRPPISEITREKIRISKLGNNYGTYRKSKGDKV